MFMIDNTWNELIYAAAEDPSRWNDFLHAFSEKMEAGQAVLSVRHEDHPPASIAAYVGGTFEDLVEYQTKWAHLDPWTKDLSMQHFTRGAIRLSHEICPNEDLEQMDFYQQYLSPRGWHYGAGLVIYSQPAQAGLLSFSRHKSKGPVREEECDFLRSITPALERAVRIQGNASRMQSELDIYRAHADAFAFAFALLNERGKVILANRRANEIFANGKALGLRDGVLHAWDSEAQGALLKAVADLGKPIGQPHAEVTQISLRRSDGMPPLIVIISAAQTKATARIGEVEPTVCLHLVEPPLEKVADSSIAEKMFNFTPAETRLASLLASGATLESAARELFVSKNTLRTHLQRLMSKTGCSRQAELALLLWQLSRSGTAAQKPNSQ